MALGPIVKALSKSADDIGAKLKVTPDEALARPNHNIEEGARPMRASLHKYDPDYISEHTGVKSTFASDEIEHTLGYAARKSNQPVYFTEFGSLKPHEVFDPSERDQLRMVLSSSTGKKYVDDYHHGDLDDAIDTIRMSTWQETERMARKGVFDDLPADYKAIRLHGEGDNYMYVGRQLPKQSDVTTYTVPERKHYVGGLADIHSFVSKWKGVDTGTADSKAFTAERDALESKLLAQIKELKQGKRKHLARAVEAAVEDLDELRLTNIGQYNYNFMSHAEDGPGHTVREIMTSVDTKAEAAELIDRILISSTGASKRSKASGQEALKALEIVPDEGFNMLEFIRDNMFYSVILPALGLAGMADDLEIEEALKGS